MPSGTVPSERSSSETFWTNISAPTRWNASLTPRSTGAATARSSITTPRVDGCSTARRLILRPQKERVSATRPQPTYTHSWKRTLVATAGADLVTDHRRFYLRVGAFDLLLRCGAGPQLVRPL